MDAYTSTAVSTTAKHRHQRRASNIRYYLEPSQVGKAAEFLKNHYAKTEITSGIVEGVQAGL